MLDKTSAVCVSLDDLVADKHQIYRLAFLENQKKALRLQPGSHRSAFKGRGMDFDELRPYQEGDDVRLVDWRITAKIGRVFTKVFKEEHNRPIWFLTDLRSSMKFGTKQAFKSVIVAHLTAFLSWYFLKNKNKVGGLVLTDTQMEIFKPSSLRKKIIAFLNTISQQTCQKYTFEKIDEEVSLTEASAKIRHSCRNGNVIFVLSDFSDMNENTQKTLASLARTNEVIFINVYDVLEGMCPPPNLYIISNGSSHTTLDTNQQQVRDNYLSYFTQKRQNLQQFAIKHRIRYIPVLTSDDYFSTVAQMMNTTTGRTFYNAKS